MTYNGTIPPVNTEVIDPFDGSIILQNIMIAAIISVIAIFILIYLLKKGKRNRDISPSLRDLMADSYDPNVAMIIMMLILFPVMFGCFYGLGMITKGQYEFGAIVIIICVFGTLLPFYMAKLNSREKSRNKQKMTGWLHTIDGFKIPYSFADVEFYKERELLDREIDAILNTSPEWKSTLQNIHMVPASVGKYNVYFLMQETVAAAIQWVPTIEYDYYGSFKIPTAGPELMELAVINRVQDIGSEDTEYVNEKCHVFLVLWDDARVAECMGKIAPVNITQDAALAGITKALGVERRIIAGTLSAVEDELASHKTNDRVWEAKMNNRANGIAAGIVADKEALSTLDKIQEGINIQFWLTVITVFIFGAIFGAGVLS